MSIVQRLAVVASCTPCLRMNADLARRWIDLVAPCCEGAVLHVLAGSVTIRADHAAHADRWIVAAGGHDDDCDGDRVTGRQQQKQSAGFLLSLAP